MGAAVAAADAVQLVITDAAAALTPSLLLCLMLLEGVAA